MPRQLGIAFAEPRKQLVHRRRFDLKLAHPPQ
jgi:hypothetical protein